MYDFTYHRPATLSEATALRLGAEDGVYLAGGHTLLPTMKLRLAAPSDVVDLASVPGLSGITRDGDTVVVGALTRHADVAASPIVLEAILALAALAGQIGDPAVRNRGTLGGSIANNDPAADYPAALVGLGATVITSGREIAADDFFTGLFETALEDGEIITAVRFPLPLAAAYMKFPNPASRFALAGVFVARTGAGVRVAVTGAGPGVFRCADMERALDADFRPEALDGITLDAEGLNSDIHAGADYRAHLVTVMAKRAVAAAAG